MPNLPDKLLSRLSEFVAARMGLYFPKERWRDLERGIRSAAREADGPEDAGAFAEWILSTPLTKKQIDILASELTVGETYFFREYRTFEVLINTILPDLIQRQRNGARRLRIWSAGCCTGEEAYSLAIMLDRFFPEVRDWQVTILATDLNPRFLQKAAAGIYGEWSFRNPPKWLKDSYFEPLEGHRYEISPRIRKMVSFACLNLAEDMFPSLSNNTNAMDLIFCRNVLMYFSPQGARNVISNFHQSLVNGGMLMVSATETSPQSFSDFEAVHFDGAVIYSKGERHIPSPVFQFPIEEKPALDEAPTGMPHLELPVEAEWSAPLAPEVKIPAQQSEVTSAGYEKAAALFNQGNYSAAADLLEAAPAITPQGAALMARICANLGQFTEAQSWAGRAVAADKLDAGLRYLHAMILQEAGAPDDSIASLQRAIYLDPGFILAHYALGNLAMHLNRPDEASRHFANTLNLLERHSDDEILPQSDGLAAGRLREMIQSTYSMATPA